MSTPLLRPARLSRSLVLHRTAPSTRRFYAASAAQQRHDPSASHSHAGTDVPGPSTRTRARTPSSSADAQAGSLEPSSAANTDDALEPFSRVQNYLASINTAGIQPTLEDLERCRPANRPSLQSPAYAPAYNEVIGTLCRSFTKTQLREFLTKTLGTSRHCATNRKKVDYAESILEQLWQWPTLSDVEKAKRDSTEVTTKMLPMASSELFLLLGKDGADLLRMSQDYDVHISMRAKPLALRVEGTRSSVKELTEHILSLKLAFVEETFMLPSPALIPADMVQRISLLSSAFIENVKSSPGSVRICARDAKGIEVAKRFASRAAHEIQKGSRTPLLTHIPPGADSRSASSMMMQPHVYAFYPYLSPRALPFTMNSNGTFRLRRVGEWLTVGFRDSHDGQDSLAEGKGQFLSEAETHIQLREALLQSLPEASEGSGISVRASLGHILLTRSSQEQRPTLVPPLTGQHPFGKIRKWISNNAVEMAFVPDLPLPLLSTSPAHQKVIHRLVYHSLSASHDASVQPRGGNSTVPLVVPRRKVISFEVALPDPQHIEPESATKAVDDFLDILRTDGDNSTPSGEGEGALPEPERRLDERVAAAAVSAVPIASTARCTSGVQAEVNLMMPDRPMDLQFAVSTLADVPLSSHPALLKEYVEDLQSYLNGAPTHSEQPSPPLFVHYEGERYLLHSNATVRQSEEIVPGSGQSTAQDEHDEVRALCESASDLESNQKSMHCEVVCNDVSSDDSWKRFLVDCDTLSTLTIAPTVSPMFNEDPALM